MSRRLLLILAAPVLLVLGALGLYARDPAPLDRAAFAALYADPAPAPEGPRGVYHLGHSLVGRDMPAMLAQLAPDGHAYASQLGWGATLRSHWEPDVPVNGFEAENAHPAYRDAHEAVGSGEYDAVVLTEMVEIADAIQYHDSPRYLHLWADKARAAGATVYLYETWHRRDDPAGWRARLDRDRGLYWEDAVLRAALARSETPAPVHVIPGGQVMAALARALEADGPVEGLADMGDLFADEIHFNDLGAYLMALTHYAVLYQRNPEGLPHALSRADGSPADDPGPQAAALMQRVVWEVVRADPLSGVRDR